MTVRRQPVVDMTHAQPGQSPQFPNVFECFLCEHLVGKYDQETYAGRWCVCNHCVIRLVHNVCYERERENHDEPIVGRFK